MSIAALCLALMSFGCSTGSSALRGGEASLSEAEYASLGLSESTIEPWEDGMRTTGAKGSYEWWYFDSILDDGSTLVITFYTKDQIQPELPMEPKLSFDLTRPDGSVVSKVLKVAVEDFEASREGCYVRVGANSIAGDLHDYSIHIDVDNIKADIRLHGTVPPWRPKTGYINFLDKKESYFAWLPAVPQGQVDGTISVDGHASQVSGVGYHDHNWGDRSMLELMHDWYWGRARIGGYSVIASYITAAARFRSPPVPIFMLAREGRIIADDSAKVSFSAQNVYIDPHTRKPVAGRIVYEYADGGDRYRVSFTRESDLINVNFIDALHGLKSVFARLAGFDGSYMRFTGEVVLERFEDGALVERLSQNAAVWELMYFGHAPRR